MTLTPAELADLHRTYVTEKTEHDPEAVRELRARARDELEHLFRTHPRFAPTLARILKAGRFNGNWWYHLPFGHEGGCGCVYGSLAHSLGQNPTRMGPALRDDNLLLMGEDTRARQYPRENSPLETVAEGILPGDTPDTHPHAALLARWTDDWIARDKAAREAREKEKKETPVG